MIIFIHTVGEIDELEYYATKEIVTPKIEDQLCAKCCAVIDSKTAPVSLPSTIITEKDDSLKPSVEYISEPASTIMESARSESVPPTPVTPAEKEIESKEILIAEVEIVTVAPSVEPASRETSYVESEIIPSEIQTTTVTTISQVSEEPSAIASPPDESETTTTKEPEAEIIEIEDASVFESTDISEAEEPAMRREEEGAGDLLPFVEEAV